MIHRKRKNSDVWHWHRSCSNWPKRDFIQDNHQHGHPPTGEQCNQCRAKDKRGKR